MRSVLWLLGSAFLATQVCGVAAAQEPALFGYPFPLSRTASTSGGGDYRPDLTTDGQGTWVAVWYAWDSLGGTIGTDYDILVARSTDDGVTWTPPVALNTNAGSDSGHDYRPKVATDGQGTWVAVWYSYDPLDGSIGTDRDILVARSTDGGATWTAPAALNTNAASDSGDDVSPDVTTDGLGNWVAVWQSSDSLGGTIGTDWDILRSVSTNGGRTWSAVYPVNVNAGGDSGDDEQPTLTTDGQGHWVAVWESWDSLGGAIGTDWDILRSVSTNGGVNWSSVYPLNFNAGSDARTDYAAQVATDGQGNWVAVWISGGADWDIWTARSTNNGINWTFPVALNANADSDSGDDLYPHLTTDGQGRWVAAWYSNDTLGGTIGADQDTLVARSTNNGINWTFPVALNTNAGSDSGDDCYPHVTTDALGTWLAVWHSYDALRGTIGTDGDILVARSTDGGADWSAPSALNGTAHTGSGDDFSAQVTTDGQGTWVAVWDSNDSLEETIGMDGDILVTRSIDGGYTWSEPAGLDPNAGSDAGDDFFSQVTTDGLGTWVAAWHSFDALGGTIGTDGDILVSSSTDGGVSWSAAAALNVNADSDAGDDLFPQVTTDGQGTWLAVWDSDDSLGDTIGTDGDILVAYSTDGGVSWAAPVALNTNAGSDAGDDFSPQVTTDGQGTWVAVWDSTDALGGTIGTDGDILVSRSTNGGATWSAAAALADNAGGDSGGDFYPQVQTDGAGSWVAVWHSFDRLGWTIGTDGDVLVARSTDGGVSWSSPAALNTNADDDSGDDLFPQLTTDGQGTWIATWDSADSLGGTIGTDGDILAARSTDGGVTWGAPAALHANAGGDVGDDFAPQVATDGQGTWVAVWESSDTLAGTIGPDNDILGAVLDPGIYGDTDSSGSFDPGEERAGGIGGNGGSVFDYAFDLDASTHDLGLTSIELLLTTYDHAFRIDINGVPVVPLDSSYPAGFTPPIDEPWSANSNGFPRLRIALTEASIEFAGSETTSSTSMTPGLVYDEVTTNPVFIDGQNTITIENPNGSGSDAIDFRIRMRRGEIPYQKISDTQGGFTGTLDDEDFFGIGTASLGDLDGDGVGDLAVGAHSDDDGGPNRGAVWVLFLNPDGTVNSHQKISDTQGGFTGALDDDDFFGFRVASLGDLDGDGVGDLAVGALADDDGGPNRGAVWVLFLNPDGTVEAHQKISDTQGGFTGTLDDVDSFGIDVASLGDLDGDGVGDLAVSAWPDDDGGPGRGAVWILFLNADGTVESHQKISDTQGGFTGALDDEDHFGVSMTSLGDLDGDGVIDMAVGATRDDDGGLDRGAVWVLFLNPNGTVKSHRKISHTQGSFTGTLDDVYGFGVSVSSLGNLSGAGAGDLAVGALLDDDGGPDRGAVWILFLDGAFCSDEIRNGGEQCDDGNLEDGDGCDHICQIEVEDSRELSGIAAGGWIDFAINGVALEVTTHAGETAAEVAANVADAINDDPTLSQTGIYAFAIGDTVITNGMITKWLIIDPGLNPPIPPPIPGLTGWGLGLLAVLLLLTAAMTVGSAARTRT